jgi:xanthine dehydrogenase accessory factor
MSHNLSADTEYLKVLAASTVNFVGLIGPPKRRDRLLSELGEQAALLANRLHAPVGTIIGGRGPAAIALEIVAELQAYFSAEKS